MIQRDCAARKLNAAFTGDKRADGPGITGFGGRVDQETAAVAGQQVDLRKGPRRTDAVRVTDKVTARIGEFGRCRTVRIAIGLLNLLTLFDGTELELGKIDSRIGRVEALDEQNGKPRVAVEDIGTRFILIFTQRNLYHTLRRRNVTKSPDDNLTGIGVFGHFAEIKLTASQFKLSDRPIADISSAIDGDVRATGHHQCRVFELASVFIKVIVGVLEKESTGKVPFLRLVRAEVKEKTTGTIINYLDLTVARIGIR